MPVVSHPAPAEFRTYAAQARFVPVFRQLTSDTLTPVTAYQRLCDGPWSFLFESVVGGEKIGRYSFVGSNPFLSITSWDRHVRIRNADGTTKEWDSDDPLKDLDALVAEYECVPVPGLPRFCGGAVGFAGYDVIRYSEHLPNVPEDDRGLPDMCFALYDGMVVFDHIRKVVLVVALADTQDCDPDDARAVAEERLEQICARLAVGNDSVRLTDIDLTVEPDLPIESNFTQNHFETCVGTCREYIKAGDIFQVVFSQRLQRASNAKPLDVYRSLRMVNPSPFMFLLQTPELHLVGSSPEIMVRVEDGETTIRPLAGTRRRGRTEQEDKELADELLADPKERAEHVMLIDLARNDVGRVAQFGSVELSDVMVVERYSHVMHITSNVVGQLRDGMTAVEALRAGLPAGTVSGAPKVRAMEVIDEIEPHKRGPYGGAVGYIDFTGNMDTCIALRTLVIHNGIIYVQAGAGIVADSVPKLEYEETLNKAKAMLKAIYVAETQLSEQAS
ncbi:MAG: anthranilate synthase component I [Fuerstiella sp.]|nr:anthranilate synthase component I [Fuerstiella sp.]MCP4854972.1 anthranilate synthase component I [Fuerstiella sp.]